MSPAPTAVVQTVTTAAFAAAAAATMLVAMAVVLAAAVGCSRQRSGSEYRGGQHGSLAVTSSASS